MTLKRISQYFTSKFSDGASGQASSRGSSSTATPSAPQNASEPASKKAKEAEAEAEEQQRTVDPPPSYDQHTPAAASSTPAPEPVNYPNSIAGYCLDPSRSYEDWRVNRQLFMWSYPGNNYEKTDPDYSMTSDIFKPYEALHQLHQKALATLGNEDLCADISVVLATLFDIEAAAFVGKGAAYTHLSAMVNAKMAGKGSDVINKANGLTFKQTSENVAAWLSSFSRGLTTLVRQLDEFASGSGGTTEHTLGKRRTQPHDVNPLRVHLDALLTDLKSNLTILQLASHQVASTTEHLHDVKDLSKVKNRMNIWSMYLSFRDSFVLDPKRFSPLLRDSRWIWLAYRPSSDAAAPGEARLLPDLVFGNGS